MGLKLLVNATEDFTGEFRKTANTQAQWKMNDSPSGDDTTLHDSSSHARNFTINGWSGTTASTRAGKLGKFFRFNTVNPATEKTHLRATNTGDFFTELGKRIVAGGWIYPTTYSVGTTFVPIFSTRSGPGNPLFYLSLRSGRLRNMLYDASGTLIYDVIEPDPMGVVLQNNGAYFIGTVIDLEAKTVQSLVCDRSTGDVFKTAIRSFTGELNPSCTADIVMGMYADSYYFAGGFDDWFYETDSNLTIDDLEAHFLSGLLANGADVDSSVDAISNPGSVTLKQTDGVYAESGVLYTRILDLGEGGLAGEGKIQLVGTVDAGITSISEVKTRTSDSLEDVSFSDWEAVGTDGVIQSPNLRYIQIQMTLSTTDTSMTPELSAIQIYETPKAPYSKLGYARPVVLSDGGIREAVLENAYDIIVTSELNGSDYLEFSIPFKDGKRSYLDNEKKLQITKDIYRIRTVTDDKGEDGKTVTSIYAEAAFYDLAYSEKKSEQTYEAETAEKPMAYALQGTGWSVGKITVSTKRSWQSTDKNALSMLRTIQSIYGGDLEFDNPRWDKNSIGISLDGDSQMLSESRMYFLYWRKKFWRILKSGVSLSAGKHTITVSGGVPGVVFYGFRVCSDFSQKATAGEVYYGLKPRKFMDVNGEMVQPDRAFKVTAEVLRRKPESALVWYEDFCDYSEIPTNYFTVLDGSWKIWKDESSDRVRKYSQLEGSGKLALDYTGFSEIHVRARFAFKSSGGGKAGVFLGSIFCCINYDTQCVELYQGSKKLGSYASSFSKTSNADLRSNPSLYTVEMRIRGNKVRVYSGAAYTLRFTATITAETGYVGFMAEKGVVCDLLRLGDAWYYEPYECFDITFPDGKQTTFGRCTRTGISWDNEFELFRVNSDVEEISTRSQDISMDYDFFHSHEMSLECGNDYEMKVVPHDLNVWLSRMYLGDADGFSIMYYSDVDSIVYWANEAAYTYGVSGIAIWSLGQEDMRLWDSMPDQI